MSIEFKKIIVVLMLFLLVGIASVYSAFAKNFPVPTGFVTDCCSLLTETERQTIDNKLSQFQQETSNQIAVAIVQNLEGDSVESYANELFRTWGIGEKTKNNGVLLLFGLDERKIRIEVGYGLEGVLTDALAGRIINDEITPLMKQSRYADAVVNGTNAIMLAIQGEYSEATPSLYNGAVGSSADEDMSGMVTAFLGLLFLLFNSAIYAISYMARSKSIWAGGIGGGAVGIALMFIFGFGMITAIATGVLAILGLILDMVLSKNYSSLKAQGKSTNFWETSGGLYTFGGGSGRSSGGSSFGGFGGGSSGGGGASGGW
ncbi:MAG: TPM domain-containing protein [Candidatus Gracilibacteria bacterium]